MTTALAILNIIGPILIALLKLYQDGMPERKEEERVQEIQKGRSDIASGNTTAVTERIDRVLTVQGIPCAGSSSRVGTGASEGGDADTLRRLASL